jgi:hypothetical protein
MKRKKLEQSGLLAIQLLRKNKLKHGHSFMINSNKLPDDQCYLEHPDGSMQVVTMSRSKKDFEVIRELSKEEQSSIRKMLQSA